MLEKIKGTINYGQFRETGNVGHMTQKGDKHNKIDNTE